MTAARSPATDERSVDGFLGGLVTLVQPRRGHRAGLDAALLQALLPATALGTAIDLGAGVGTVAFSIAARAPGIRVVGVEREADLVACGTEALSLPANAAFAGRVRLVAADVLDPAALTDGGGPAEGTADWVVMNPPYDVEGRVTESPDPARLRAHVGTASLLRSWTARAAALLKHGGALATINRASALADVLDALLPAFGEVTIRPVHPARHAPASRILVTAVAGNRAPLALAPGLVLHQADGRWTEEADAVLRGRAELPFRSVAAR